MLNNNLREEAANNILSPRKTFHLFRNFFTKKFQREIDINVEAVKDAQAIINPLLESSDLTEAETQEAQKLKLSLIIHVYYEWLEQLTEAIESGEIFKYFPIQNNLLILKTKIDSNSDNDDYAK